MGLQKKKLAEKQLGCVVVQDLTPSLSRRYYQKKKKLIWVVRNIS